MRPEYLLHCRALDNVLAFLLPWLHLVAIRTVSGVWIQQISLPPSWVTHEAPEPLSQSRAAGVWGGISPGYGNSFGNTKLAWGNESNRESATKLTLVTKLKGNRDTELILNAFFKWLNEKVQECDVENIEDHQRSMPARLCCIWFKWQISLGPEENYSSQQITLPHTRKDFEE